MTSIIMISSESVPGSSTFSLTQGGTRMTFNTERTSHHIGRIGKHNYFHYNGAYFYLCSCQCFFSDSWHKKIISEMNRYHLVTATILHQPHPMHSTDINMWLQPSDTSSIRLRYDWFCLVTTWISWMWELMYMAFCAQIEIKYSQSINSPF